MSILQFVWQLTLILGIGLLVMVGLFASPWYILAGILIVVLALIDRWMPSSPAIESEQWPLTPDSRPQSRKPQVMQGSDAPAEMLYRGAAYPKATQQVPAEPPAAPPAVLCYRGAYYAADAPNGTDDPVTQAGLETIAKQDNLD